MVSMHHICADIRETTLAGAIHRCSRHTVQRVVYLRSAALSEGLHVGYPFELPAVRALAAIEFAPVTIFVGDNGSGKSTLVEALAVAAGFNAEGGSRNLQFETYATHSALASRLELRWARRPRWGWFLRAETFYGMATHIHRDDDIDEGVKIYFPDLHHRSHGESFLTLIDSKMGDDGFYLLDEPESALSFHGQLKLLATMHDAVRQRGAVRDRDALAGADGLPRRAHLRVRRRRCTRGAVRRGVGGRSVAHLLGRPGPVLPIPLRGASRRVTFGPFLAPAGANAPQHR